jgi:hypothetical protein
MSTVGIRPAKLSFFDPNGKSGETSVDWSEPAQQVDQSDRNAAQAMENRRRTRNARPHRRLELAMIIASKIFLKG